jgi:hypothetical protein
MTESQDKVADNQLDLFGNKTECPVYKSVTIIEEKGDQGVEMILERLDQMERRIDMALYLLNAARRRNNSQG